MVLSDPQLVDRALDDAVNSLGGDFRLIDRGHRLHGLIHFVSRPAKLGGVHPRQLHHGQLDVAFLMHQFGSHGIGKAADRRFRSAVSRLQWD